MHSLEERDFREIAQAGEKQKSYGNGNSGYIEHVLRVGDAKLIKCCLSFHGMVSEVDMYTKNYKMVGDVQK